MLLNVYDTYATTINGTILHFDVFLPSSNGNKNTAIRYAKIFLQQIGESIDAITLDRCNFCHTETANPVVKKHIEGNSYFILQMEGCPNPY
jgi:hypothetical protein